MSRAPRRLKIHQSTIPQKGLQDTPVRRPPTEQADFETAAPQQKKESVLKSLEPWSFQVDQAVFFDTCLPPCPDYLKEIVTLLRQENKFAIFQGGTPAQMTANENTVFKELEVLVDGIVDAVVRISKQKGGLLKPKKIFRCNPNGVPESRRRKNLSRPDCYVLLPNATQESEPVQWSDIVITGEVKKEEEGDKTRDNDYKLIWSHHHLLCEDPTRATSLAFAIENTSMRLWFCNRSFIMTSTPFNFLTDHELTVRFFASVMFADVDQLGWDPTMQPVDGTDKFDISVHSRKGAGRIFRTEKLISDVRANSLIGSATRIWLVREVVDGEPSKQLFVLKDYWIDHDRRREGTIYTALHDHSTQPTEHFLTLIIDGDVHVQGIGQEHHPATQTAWLPKDAQSYLPKLSTSFATSKTAATGANIRALSVREVGKPTVRVHYRVVVDSLPPALSEISLFRDIYRGLAGAVEAAHEMHKDGWVHRNIGIGSICVHGEGSNLKVKLVDFEYVRSMKDTTSHRRRSGVVEFLSVEVKAGAYHHQSLEKRASTVVCVPFRYNPLHDLESLLWVAIYILSTSRVILGDKILHNPPPRQIMQAHSLFYADDWYLHRQNLLMSGMGCRELVGCFPPILGPIAEKVNQLLIELSLAFKNAEVDVSTIDAKVGDTLAKTFQEYFEDIADGLCGDVHLECAFTSDEAFLMTQDDGEASDSQGDSAPPPPLLVQTASGFAPQFNDESSSLDNLEAVVSHSVGAVLETDNNMEPVASGDESDATETSHVQGLHSVGSILGESQASIPSGDNEVRPTAAAPTDDSESPPLASNKRKPRKRQEKGILQPSRRSARIAGQAAPDYKADVAWKGSIIPMKMGDRILVTNPTSSMDKVITREAVKNDLQSVCGEASVTLLGDMTGLDMSSDMVVATAAQGELASASPSLLILSPTAQPHSLSILWSRNHLESRLTRRLLSQKLSPTRSEQARTPPPSMDRKESQATLKVSSRGNSTGRREEGRVELDYLVMRCNNAYRSGRYPDASYVGKDNDERSDLRCNRHADAFLEYGWVMEQHLRNGEYTSYIPCYSPSAVQMIVSYPTLSKASHVIQTPHGRAVQIPLASFLHNVLPPLQPGLDPMKVVYTLLRTRKRSYAGNAITRKGRWRGFPQDLSKAECPKDISFRSLRNVSRGITRAAGLKKDSMSLHHNPTPRMLSESRDISSLPDVYFSNSEEKTHNWHDIAVLGELKKAATINDIEDNICKVTWSMERCMHSDSRRRFIFAFTIEDAHMRLWYCDQSQILVCTPFNFITDHHPVVHFFLSVMYASPADIGLDPTVLLLKDGKQYDITVLSNDGHSRTYRTLELLADGSAELCGKGTRVWKASRVEGGHVIGKPVVLKDSWPDIELCPEGMIYQEVQSTGERQCTSDSLFATVEWHGDVHLDHSGSDAIDCTPSFSATGARVDVPLSSRHDYQSTHIASRLARRLVHYRIVFSEVCSPLSQETSLVSIFRVLSRISLALQHLHETGWVHRDLSPGNILLCGDVGILADLEYTKKMGQGREHRIGTRDFISVEVDFQRYLLEGYQLGPDDSPPDRSPFRYNPLHDLESLWWIAANFIRTKCIANNNGPSPAATKPSSSSISEVQPSLSVRERRVDTLIQPYHFWRDTRVLPEPLVQIADKLDDLRRQVTLRYLAVEKHTGSIDKACADGLHEAFHQTFAEIAQTASYRNLLLQDPGSVNPAYVRPESLHGHPHTCDHSDPNNRGIVVEHRSSTQQADSSLGRKRKRGREDAPSSSRLWPYLPRKAKRRQVE
ncbi:hypothetical protein NM688_g4296 [Phlebia brevispora]|uniref:Uncharacterized protein n=1 Tax=Phlebia brevispora TaxID=194682 RepID=A0ACC1T3G7_9APHY|nr:hypothetical protein NM688_g4296 [Phlebia brevispora]